MPRIELTSKSAASVKADALIVGLHTTEHLSGTLTGGPAKELAATVSLLGLSGSADEVTKLASPSGVKAPLVLLTGVGAGDSPEALRRATGSALRQATALSSVSTVVLALPADTVEEVAAVAEGALLGAYRYDRYKTSRPGVDPAVDADHAGKTAGKTDSPAQQPKTITIVTPLARDKAAKAAITRAEVLAEAVNGARDLVNCPPNDLVPADFAERAVQLAEQHGVKVSVLDADQLREGGFGGLTAVGQGSVNGPRLVELRHEPKRPVAHLALVGKGITFDSGGLSLKPGDSMKTMKLDMAGAAAVLHTVVAAARLDLPVTVSGWLCLAENMPSGTAQRPSDVITILGGKTVEVLNTDAEGRLVLADGLVSASRTQPDAILDIATLTGAQMVALGNRVSALMSNEEGLRDEVIAAAERCGEQFWPMPLPEELRASLDSPVADLANIGERMGGMLSAGIFLREFVGDGPDGDQLPWAHLDIAGPSFNESGPHGYTGKGGTGVGVRTMLSWLEHRAG